MIAYTGWMAYTASILLAPTTPVGHIWLRSPTTLAALLAIWGFFARQRSPWSFYIYGAFPVYFWHHAAARLWPQVSLGLQGRSIKASSIGRWAVQSVGVLFAMLSMVVGIHFFVHCISIHSHFQVGYTHRSMWSAGFLIIGVFWPAMFWPRFMFNTPRRLLSISWVLICLLCAAFPLLSVNKEESIPLV
jgi:phosphatidylinositol glycan class N